MIHYDFIQEKIIEQGKKYKILEVMYDHWSAVQMAQNLEGQAFEMVDFSQDYHSLSPPSKELHRLVLDEKLRHGGHPVLRWMMENVYIDNDAVGNLRPNKKKSAEKIDGVVATIMILDGALKRKKHCSIYDERGMLSVGPDGVKVYDHELGRHVPYTGEKKKGAVAYTGNT